jgi:hypothetical protein
LPRRFADIAEFRNAERAVLLGAPGWQTVQPQKWINELIPYGDAMANSATETANAGRS